MAPHLASSGAARQRFAREAQAAAAMTHDNVIDIYGVSEAGGLPYLVMPYARGPSLQKRIDSVGRLPLIEVLRIGRQIAAGLAAAHEQGLVHRDIKPANILLNDGNDRLLITDFGLARAVDDASVTRTGVIAETPQYMSPEQGEKGQSGNRHLTPVELRDGSSKTGSCANKRGTRCSNKGFLPISTAEYLSLLDWTGSADACGQARFDTETVCSVV